MGFQCEMNVLPHCCGFYEAGYFQETKVKSTYFDIFAETGDEFIQRCFNKAEGRPIIFNFVQEAEHEVDDWGEEGEAIPGEFKDNYECESIRQVVMNHKNVIDLGEHINPGTSNKIHSLVIKDYK